MTPRQSLNVVAKLVDDQSSSGISPKVSSRSSPNLRESDPALAVRKIRRSRARALAVKFALGVGLPTLCSAIYNGVVASDVYESTSLFTVQSAEGRAAMGLDSILGVVPGSSPGTRDAMAVREYILSRDMLARLDEEHRFVGHYQNSKFDWHARLSETASHEEAYEYYRDRVFVEHDSSSGVLTLTTKAFSAAAAHKFSEAILHYSEQMVNRLSDRARVDQTRFAKKELALAETRLAAARQQYLALQSERAEFSPHHSASETLTVRGQLQAELAQVEASLSQAQSFMANQAPKVVALRQHANALAKQVAEESRRLVNPGAEGGLNTSIASFEGAILEKEFAQSAYQSALTSLELARSEAGRQHRYLARIAEPSNPDEATYPKRILGTLTAFILSIALVGIASLFGAAIREHAKL